MSARRDTIVRLHTEANHAKEDLMRLRDKLSEIGAKRQAKSLDRIIFRLEQWQHRA